MFSQPVRLVMEREKLLLGESGMTVSEAARQMEKRKVGAVMVVDGGALVGIFSERDAVFRVLAKGRDPMATTVGEVMTKRPHTIEPDKTFGYALILMHEKGFRHVPVVENGRVIGIVSARNALDPELEEFVSETIRRKQILRERA